MVHPPQDCQDSMIERFPHTLLSYWYILYFVVTIPLVNYLATWYPNLLPDKTGSFVLSFQIVNDALCTSKKLTVVVIYPRVKIVRSVLPIYYKSIKEVPR